MLFFRKCYLQHDIFDIALFQIKYSLRLLLPFILTTFFLQKKEEISEISMLFVSVMGVGGQSQDGKIRAVLTCEGDIEDPEFPERCQKMFDKLSQVLQNGRNWKRLKKADTFMPIFS